MTSSDAGESTKTIELLAWIEVHKKKLLIMVIAVAVLAAALALYRAKASADEAAGWAALFRVERSATAGDNTGGAAPQAFLQVASSHTGTEAGGQAILLAGRAWFEQGKFAEAREQFASFIRQYGDSEFVPEASFGIAACLDSESKPNDALTAYQSVAAKNQNTALASQAKLAIARLQESRNEFAEAFKIYSELASAPGQSMWSADAGMRREQLLLTHPELARTNLPAGAAPSIASATNVLRVAPTNLPGSPLNKPGQ